MSNTEPVATTESASDNPATYLVVPVIPQQTTSESVLYFHAVQGSNEWIPVSPKDLNAKVKNHNANKIRLKQPSDDEVKAHANLFPDYFDEAAQLYAGVAKTLGQDDGLKSMFTPGDDGVMTIPVNPGTTRGLILVFTKASDPDHPQLVTQLIASTDPEIKNSTGGRDPEQ
jgi:hypothetical protein